MKYLVASALLVFCACGSPNGPGDRNCHMVADTTVLAPNGDSVRTQVEVCVEYWRMP